MSKASVKKDPIPSPDLGYSAFPMHQTIHSSMTVGEILPSYIDVLSPGDRVSLSHNFNARLNYLERPINERLSAHVDWYFVPMRQMMRTFEEQFFNVQDMTSDLYSQYANGAPVQQNYPSFSISNLYSYMGNLTPNAFKSFDSKEWSLFGSVANIDGPYDTSVTHPHYRGSAVCYMSRLRLLDALQFPVYQMCSHWTNEGVIADSFSSRSLTLWFALAYQKIWYDHYRIEDRLVNYPFAYNIDSLLGSSTNTVSGISVNDRLGYIFAPHLVPYNRDYFTHNFVSPLMPTVGSGAQATVKNDVGILAANASLGLVNSWLGTSDFRTAGMPSSGNIVGANAGSVNSPTAVFPYLSSYNVTNLNTANIRAAFAVEKLLEVTRRAGKQYDAQLLAHFGVEPPKGLEGKCIKIAEFDQPIVIGDIVASATTEQSTLGELGGRGYTDSRALGANNHAEFKADCHGVLMSVVYIKPEVSYMQLGFSRLHQLFNRTRFFVPEFENLGMQPLFGYEAYLANNDDDAEDISDVIMGWKYRYSEFKEKFNLTRGAYLGTYSDWSSCRDYLSNATSVGDASLYYVQPDYLNNVLSVQYGVGGVQGSEPSANWSFLFTSNLNSNAEVYSGIYSQDPFVCDITYDVKKVSKMSVYGLPNL